jgi:hypothetical protein
MGTIILSVVLYECETWFLTLREKHRLRIFEKSMLWRIFRSKKNEMVGGWRKMQYEELRNLYSSPNMNGVIK